MTSIISDLDQTLTSRWKMDGYAEWKLPSVAATALEEFGLDREVERIFDHIFVESENLLLRDHRSPDVATLYSTAHFNIYLHMWINGLAQLHHHEWTGAYQLLRGSSVNAEYSFVEERRLAAGLSVGRLQCLAIKDMSVGALQSVEPGADNIHTLSYNEPVSLTISIRSRRIVDRKSREYWQPGVAIETDVARDYQKTRSKCVQYLANADSPELLRRLRDLVTTGDLCSVFLGLEALHRVPMRISLADWGELVGLGVATHGVFFERIARAVRESRRPRYHRQLAARIGLKDKALRWFLSNLFVCPDREALLARVSAASGNAGPLEKCQEWCRQIIALDSGCDILAGEDDLVEVLNSQVTTGHIEGALETLLTRYEVGDATVPLLLMVYEHLESHPALATLFR